MNRPALAARLAAWPGRNVSWGIVVSVALGAAVVYLLLVPLGMLIFSSFRATKGVLPFEATSFTLSNYLQVFGSPLTYRLLWNTLSYGLIAMVVGLGLAMAFAWYLERTDARAPTALVMLVLAPLGVPAIVEATAWILLANPNNGILNVALRGLIGPGTDGPLDVYSVLGMGLVSGIKMVPSAYILLASMMARFDPGLEEASLMSGASPYATFRRITAALLRPGILAVIIYFGVLTIEMFEIPALLGMKRGLFVFSTLIFDATHPPMGLPDYGLASAYASISLLIGIALIYLYHVNVRHQERFAVVTGKGYRPRRAVLPAWCKLLFTGTVGIYFLVSAVVPFLVLVWASLGILYTPASLGSATLQYYLQLLNRPEMLRSVNNTLIISVASATLTMVLAFAISWLSLRTKSFASSWPDRMTILAIAMPSVVIALALMFFYTRFPLPVYGTVWIIIIALVTRFLAYGARVMNAAYLQVHAELEEASHLSGATLLTTIRRIVLPIIWPAVSRGWLWVFVHALRDVTLALMLFAVANDTIGVRLWLIWIEGAQFQLGAAIAVPLMLVSVGLSLMLARPANLRQHGAAGL